MGFRFVVDRIIKARAYPALTKWEARPYTQAWRQFGDHWPWTTPLRLEEYCRQHRVSYELYDAQEYPQGIFYPICLGFFDFGIDYFSLLPTWCRQGVAQNKIRVLFMYHEGDNPSRIKHRLDHLCDEHGMARHSYVFVTSNTSADNLDRFVTFHDFELWYHQRNLPCGLTPVHLETRPKDFLCLNRVHKCWRANMVADLVDRGALENSLWSYCMVDGGDQSDENPLQIDAIPQSRHRTKKFLDGAPYVVDNLDNHQRNDHSITPRDLYDQTYCNLVIESQIDVDQSGGVFLTEKTFKPIKHGQLFFVAGAAGSLQELRRLGYRVFDHVLDNSYDAIDDPTQRWMALRDAIDQAKQKGLHELYMACIDDLKHNQDLFMTVPAARLNNLAQRLDRI